jgi:hypothetical protein
MFLTYRDQATDSRLIKTTILGLTLEDLTVLKDSKVCREHKVHREHKARREHKVHRATLVPKET